MYDFYTNRLKGYIDRNTAKEINDNTEPHRVAWYIHGNGEEKSSMTPYSQPCEHIFGVVVEVRQLDIGQI